MKQELKDTISFFYEQVKYFQHNVGHIINWKGMWLNSLKQPPYIQKMLKSPEFGQFLFEHNIIEKGKNGEILAENGYNEIYNLK